MTTMASFEGGAFFAALDAERQAPMYLAAGGGGVRRGGVGGLVVAGSESLRQE